MTVCDQLDELRHDNRIRSEWGEESSIKEVFLTKYVDAYLRCNNYLEDIRKQRSSEILDNVADDIEGDITYNVGVEANAEEIARVIVSITEDKNIPGDDPSNKTVSLDADPVMMFNGQFVHEAEDVRINDAGMDFIFRRTYKNQVPFNGPLGFNWTHNFHIWLRVANRTIFRSTGDLREEAFTKHSRFGEALNGEFDYWIPPDGKDGVIFTGGDPYSFVLRLPDGVRYFFQQDSTHTFLHCLKRIEDRHGNYLELYYQDDFLRQVELNHPERVVEFESDEQGRISIIRDYTGRQWQYTYDSLGDLIAVTSPSTSRYSEGLTVCYSYSSAYFTGELQHNLIRIIDAAGQIYLENEYGTEPGLLNFNRVVRQRQGGGEYSFEYEDIVEEFDFDYPDEQRPAHQTILVERNGQPVRHIYNKFGNLLRRDQWILQNGLPRNLVEHYRYNRDGNVVASLSPEGVLRLNLYGRDYFIRQHALTPNGDVPTEQLTWRERQAFGRLLSTVTRADYLSFANLNLPQEWENLADIFNRLHDPENRDIIVKFSYEPDYGQLLSVSDPRYTNNTDPQASSEHPLHQATLTKYLYAGPASDESRFLVEIRRPTPTLPDGTAGTPVVEQFKNSDGTPGYDERGRLLRHINPAGVATEYSYFSADPIKPTQEGYLQRTVIDPGGLAVTTEYEVENLGRAVGVHLPRSAEASDDRFVTRTRYNELDQVVEITTPRLEGFSSGYKTQRFYDCNGKLQREEREAKDETGLDVTDAPEVHTYKYDEEFNLLEETIGGADLSAHLIRRHGYDTAGKKALTILPKGNQIRYTYDERLLLVAVTRGACTEEAARTRTEYDSDGRVCRTFNARGNSTTLTRDPFGRVTSVEDALGSVTLTNYDKAGNMICVRFFEHRDDGYYLLTRNETDYDELNRAIRNGVNRFDEPLDPLHKEELDEAFLSLPGPGELLLTQSFYDANGRVQRAIDPLGRETTFEYDALDRMVAQTDPLGNRTESHYDAHGNVVRRYRRDVVSDPISEAIIGERIFSATSEYDELDRLVKSTDSLGNVTRYFYDSRGNQVRRIDPLGNVARTDYDIFNRRIATHQELTDTGLGGGVVQATATTSYEYDRNGNLTVVMDALGRRTQYIFDARDRRRAIVYPDESQSSFDYDLDGNLIRTRDNNGLRRLYTVDGLSRTVRVDVDRTELDAGLIVEGENYEAYNYDGLGRRYHEENDFARTDIHFNSLGWPLTETITFTTLDAPFETPLTISREFNDVGAFIGLTYPNGRRLHYERDNLNRLIQVNNLLRGDSYPGNPATLDAHNIATMEYAGRQRIRCAFGNGTETRYAHDGAGRLIEIAHTSPINPLLKIQYLFDAVGNVRVRHDLSPTLDTAEKFAYDSLYRLANEAIESRLPFDPVSFAPAATIPADPIPNRQADIDALIGDLVLPSGVKTFTYDLVSNRDSERLTDGSLVDYTTDNDLDQYTARDGNTFEYDANGNMKMDNQHRYFYDSLNRLARVEDAASGTTIAKFFHDARGRRILELNGSATHLIWDRDNQIAEYRHGVPFALYVYDDGIDRPLHTAAEDQELWYQTDLVGSVRLLTDQTGLEAASYRYDPFGRTLEDMNGGIYNPLRYTARRLDAVLEQYDNRARQYDVHLGRFLQRDVAGMVDGTNLYAYGGNNPLVFVDPLGMGRGEKGNEAVQNKEARLLANLGFVGNDLFEKPLATLMAFSKESESNLRQIIRQDTIREAWSQAPGYAKYTADTKPFQLKLQQESLFQRNLGLFTGALRFGAYGLEAYRRFSAGQGWAQVSVGTLVTGYTNLMATGYISKLYGQRAGMADLAVNAFNLGAQLLGAPKYMTDITSLAANMTPTTIISTGVTNFVDTGFAIANALTCGDMDTLQQLNEAQLTSPSPLAGFNLISRLVVDDTWQLSNKLTDKAAEKGELGALIGMGNFQGDEWFDTYGEITYPLVKWWDNFWNPVHPLQYHFNDTPLEAPYIPPWVQKVHR